MTEQRIDEVTPAEQAWLDELLAALRAQGVDPSDADALGRHYDAAYAAWSAGEDVDANAAVNRIGAGLGAFWVGRLPLRWAVVTDQWGTEMAVHGQPGDIVLTPMSMVGKRWSEGETGFVPELARGLAERVGQIMRQADGS